MCRPSLYAAQQRKPRAIAVSKAWKRTHTHACFSCHCQQKQSAEDVSEMQLQSNYRHRKAPASLAAAAAVSEIRRPPQLAASHHTSTVPARLRFNSEDGWDEVEERAEEAGAVGARERAEEAKAVGARRSTTSAFHK